VTTCQGAKGTGIKYSYAGLEGLWVNAGGSKAYAPIMAAIATAESGGCSTAYNSSGATGLWQILGAVDPSDQSKLTNPQINAKEALLKFKDQGLGAWVTYTSGAYKQYLQGSVPPDLNVKGGGGGTSAVTTAFTSASDPACLFGLPNVDPGSSLPIVGKFLPSTSECLVKKSEGRAVVGGLVLVGGGVILALGVVVLVAFGLRGKAGKKAQQVVSVVPGLPSGGAAAAAEAVPVAAVA